MKNDDKSPLCRNDDSTALQQPDDIGFPARWIEIEPLKIQELGIDNDSPRELGTDSALNKLHENK
ncbi:MAG: hypothetical protein JWM99_1730 [Verrucomicrobiales bacterium]|nr:hypothetical protein [Verrucomicrobiales bacterium]